MRAPNSPTLGDQVDRISGTFEKLDQLRPRFDTRRALHQIHNQPPLTRDRHTVVLGHGPPCLVRSLVGRPCGWGASPLTRFRQPGSLMSRTNCRNSPKRSPASLLDEPTRVSNSHSSTASRVSLIEFANRTKSSLVNSTVAESSIFRSFISPPLKLDRGSSYTQLWA